MGAHAIMGILYGAMIANLFPVLVRWRALPTALVVEWAEIPDLLQWSLFVMAVGVLLSGLRDLYAALELPYGMEVARRPERGWMIAAVGLMGKSLGPLGMLWLIQYAAWPPSVFVLCLTNDVIWWIPFALYLHDAWPVFRAAP